MVFVFCVSNIQCPRASCYQSRDLNEVAIQSPSHSRAQTMPPLNSFLPTSAPSSMTRRQAKVVTSRLLDNVDTVPDQEDSLSLSEVNCHQVHTRSNTSLSIARNDSSRQSPELPAPPPCRPFSATSLSQKRWVNANWNLRWKHAERYPSEERTAVWYIWLGCHSILTSDSFITFLAPY